MLPALCKDSWMWNPTGQPGPQVFPVLEKPILKAEDFQVRCAKAWDQMYLKPEFLNAKSASSEAVYKGLDTFKDIGIRVRLSARKGPSPNDNLSQAVLLLPAAMRHMDLLTACYQFLSWSSASSAFKPAKWVPRTESCIESKYVKVRSRQVACSKSWIGTRALMSFLDMESLWNSQRLKRHKRCVVKDKLFASFCKDLVYILVLIHTCFDSWLLLKSFCDVKPLNSECFSFWQKGQRIPNARDKQLTRY